MIENYSCYDFTVFEHWPDAHRMEPLGFCYTIYKRNTQKAIRESGEWYETKAEARFAAIGHINLLENGEN